MLLPNKVGAICERRNPPSVPVAFFEIAPKLSHICRVDLACLIAPGIADVGRNVGNLLIAACQHRRLGSGSNDSIPRRNLSMQISLEFGSVGDRARPCRHEGATGFASHRSAARGRVDIVAGRLN